MIETVFDAENKLWSGAAIPPLYNPNISIAQVLLRSMKLFGSKIAQISDDSGIQLTFEEIRTKTIRAAQNLQLKGYKAKQVISFMATNSAYLSPIVFASFCLGCPINPLHSLMEKEHVIKMLKKTEPCLIFCDASAYDMMKDCLIESGNNAKIFTFNGTRGDSEPAESLFTPTGSEDSFIPAKVDGINDIAAIMCTSGTTGVSKGVCLSHATLISEMVSFDILTADDIYFSTNSLNWISGLTSLMLPIFNGATRIITTKSISSEKYLSMIEKYKMTVILFGSTLIEPTLKSEAISKTNLESVRHFIVGGAIVPRFAIDKFNSFFPNGSANNAYGCTEAGGIFTLDLSKSNNIDTSGKLFSGYTFKIIDDDGNRCGIGTDGEICVKGPFKFLGYYRDEALTEQVVDSEGFFHTGDVGHFDQNANLCMVGRKKDLLSYPCYISPHEIEEVLIRSDDIESVCVVGVFPEIGHEVPAAVIVRTKNSRITEEDIFKMVEENMSDLYKLRGGVYFVDSIPKTPSGKVLRRVVRENVTELLNARMKSGDFIPHFNYEF